MEGERRELVNRLLAGWFAAAEAQARPLKLYE
jgi:hypothetical protein